MQEYYAHGKLLLTGEYVVLDGALALALPTRYGQKMTVDQHQEEGILYWKSKNVHGDIWLEGIWDVQRNAWKYVNHPALAQYIEILLKYATDELWIDLSGYSVETTLEFPNEWGLGSSSTFVSLLAQWWRTDPYYLLQKTFGGSGYDIACATATSPILYQKEYSGQKSEPVHFDPEFKNCLAFLYLGKKQNSREGIQQYRSLEIDKTDFISEINDITKKILLTEELDEFEYWISVHEVIISRMLQIEKVKDTLFPEYWGAVKSLGAWGGDFVLVTHSGDFEEAKAYFTDQGYATLIPYEEMILM